MFVLEGLNSLGTVYFSYYLYFYTQARYNFHAVQNLLLAAGLGAVYAFSAYHGGKFAQKYGYFTSVKYGTALMAAMMLVATQFDGMATTIAAIFVANVGMCLTWPALEALMSQGEPPVRLQSLVGIYNVVWASMNALAYFTGGLMMQNFGLKSIFYVPCVLFIFVTALATWLEKEGLRQPSIESDLPLLHAVKEESTAPVPPKVFLKMALLVNPLAYLSINTVIATNPTLAKHFEFTTREAGFICSIWMFSRAISFVLLRLWPRWHYRFGFLAAAHIAMIISFATILLAPNIPVLVVAEIIFGLAVGLVYYSSLFYAMDVSEEKGEHGGIHEAAIGMGNATGPVTAAVAMALFPNTPGSGAMADCALLALGLCALFWLRFGRAEPKPRLT